MPISGEIRYCILLFRTLKLDIIKRSGSLDLTAPKSQSQRAKRPSWLEIDGVADKRAKANMSESQWEEELALKVGEMELDRQGGSSSV